MRGFPLLLIALAVLASFCMYTRTHIRIVVARYAEDVSWLNAIPRTEVIIYDKGGPGNTLLEYPSHATRVPLPNVGRESHTYLHHIITHYDKLADVTIFLPGSCDVPGKMNKTLWTVNQAMRTSDSAFPQVFRGTDPIRVSMGAFTLEDHQSTHGVNALKNPDSGLLLSPDRPFATWYAKKGLPDVKEFFYNAIFAVSKRHIHRRSLSQYRTLMEGLDSHSSPEAGHYMERAWMAVFAPVPHTCMEFA